jgi:hypothetical protein
MLMADDTGRQAGGVGSALRGRRISPSRKADDRRGATCPVTIAIRDLHPRKDLSCSADAESAEDAKPCAVPPHVELSTYLAARWYNS